VRNYSDGAKMETVKAYHVLIQTTPARTERSTENGIESKRTWLMS